LSHNCIGSEGAMQLAALLASLSHRLTSRTLCCGAQGDGHVRRSSMCHGRHRRWSRRSSMRCRVWLTLSRPPQSCRGRKLRWRTHLQLTRVWAARWCVLRARGTHAPSFGALAARLAWCPCLGRAVCSCSANALPRFGVQNVVGVGSAQAGAACG